MVKRFVRPKIHIERCASFFSKVRKHFDYLINDYGFAVIHQENLLSFDNCLIVLQSSDCRIRVVRDRGSILIEVGPLSAPNVHRLPGSPNLWFYMGTITAFLDQGSNADKWKWFYESPDRSLSDEAKTDWQLTRAADTLRPYLDDIIHLFRENVFKQKQKELEGFRQKRMEESWQQVMQKA